MTLITGFTCPPTIYFKFITKCDSFFNYKVRWSVITKCDSFFITKCDKCYYKVRQVLQSVTILLQSATGITKCDDYYKVRRLLQSATVHQMVKVIAKKTFRVIIFLATLARPRLHYNYHLRWQMTFVKLSNKSFSSV